MANNSTGKLRIGFVLDDSLDRPDGVQQYVLTVGEWLNRSKHETHYLVSTTKRTDIPHIHSLAKSIAVRFNGNGLRVPLPASVKSIREILAKLQLDVLHVQLPYSPFLAGKVIASAHPKTAVVGTFHVVADGAAAFAGGRLLAYANRKTLRRFDSVASVSSAAQKYASDIFGLHTVIVPNTVRIRQFAAARPVKRVTKRRQIMFLGRLVPRKGCQILLQAAAILSQDPTVEPFHISVCGDGPLRAALERFSLEHGLRQIVSFNGFIPEADKPALFASADITVFPSTGGESFGIVLLEAMASGRSAVLAGDNAGYRSVLSACPYQVLFNRQNPISLASLMKSLLADSAQRRSIAAWQRQFVGQFDVSVVGEQLLSMYRSALQRRREVGYYT